MSNFWFGWMLKGKCEVSFLDVLVLFFELGLVFVALVLGGKVTVWFGRLLKRGKRG